MIRRSQRRRAAAATVVGALVLGSLGCRSLASGSAATRAASPDTALMMADVRYLASDALEGRGTGTPGNDSAAAYIARRLAVAGLAPAFPTAGARVCVAT